MYQNNKGVRMQLIKKTIQEATSGWHNDFVRMYTNMRHFLFNTGLGKEDVFVQQYGNESTWYIPAKITPSNEGFVRVFGMELNIVKIDDNWYWTIWFD